MRSISVAERRARLAVRHRLTPGERTDDVVSVAHSVVALHATDPATVHLAVAARSHSATAVDVADALYTDRTLLRMLAMRRTMFVVPVDLVPALQACCANALAVTQRRRTLKFLATTGQAGNLDAWLSEVEEATHRALLARGEATGAQLSADVPRLRTKVDPAPGKTYSKPTGITTWVLATLGAEGRIARGRPNGSWISSQYRWAPIESWFPDGIPHRAPEQARAELVGRWLRAFGPAPIGDITWWTGWPLRDVKQALAQLDVAEVDLGGSTGLMLGDDVEPVEEPGPWAALLPALDPTAMGWQRATGIWANTARPCSTPTATSARRSGGRAASWAAGRSGPTAPSRCTSWRTSAPTRAQQSRPKPPG